MLSTRRRRDRERASDEENAQRSERLKTSSAEEAERKKRVGARVAKIFIEEEGARDMERLSAGERGNDGCLKSRRMGGRKC
eukprot:2192787-Pleurochrysis_carterae.AAC.1